jgi:acyl transferase domain-containing protein
MAGRFCKAENLDEFWQNLKNGVEAILPLSDADLLSSGIPAEVFQRSEYVRRRGYLSGVDLFDARFFGMTAREAQITDPQHRVFLECAWEALESAGYGAPRDRGLVGVFAGMSMNTYLISRALQSDAPESVGTFQLAVGNDKDFLPTRVSYKLDLRGPSVNVQTACSTSLVAVHLACQSLIGGECGIALAGAVSITVPQRIGYLFQEGGISSPDGSCRAFDAEAHGVNGGEGVGIVVLKRLEEALSDGDSIHAVIRGSAINNDGSGKVGYTAPGVEGQSTVIAEALGMADIPPETVGYVEAHGTGTDLGDPVEIAALAQAFRSVGWTKGVCGIGSVKTNIGHLDVAAGIAGLLKTILILKHKAIPPSLHFHTPNPKIDFGNSPFRVVDKLTEWSNGQFPRRAGVSSFGIGGTNCHLVLEEAPSIAPSEPAAWNVLPLSAQSEAALETAVSNLSQHIRDRETISITDAAYTLQVGRAALNHRFALVCRDREDALNVLATRDPSRIATAVIEQSPRTAFLFPGQGSQYVNMAAELYQAEPLFREEVDRCSELLAPVLGFDIRTVVYSRDKDTSAELRRTSVAQPALFIIEYALAILWMSWDVHPESLIGHSIGEYVAACLAGVFCLEDALRLVAERGRLMQELPAGSMLGVNCSEERLRALIAEPIAVAAVNGPDLSVVSGPDDAVADFQRRCALAGIVCRPLQTSHAFHSSMMEPILDRFNNVVSKVKLAPPLIPIVSNVSGAWLRDKEAIDAGYWVRHMRETVRFGDGISQLLREPAHLMLEVGPGKTLATLAAGNPGAKGSRILSSLPGPKAHAGDLESMSLSAGRLWTLGVAIDWKTMHRDKRRIRISLPTYPFERTRHWLELKPRGRRPNANEHSNLTVDAPGPVQSNTVPAAPMSVTEVRNGGSGHYDTIEAGLRRIVQALTGIREGEVNLHTSFLDVGVSSLLLIQFAQKVHDEFGVKVSLAQLFDQLSTIATLAAYVASEVRPEIFKLPAPSMNGADIAGMSGKSAAGNSETSDLRPIIEMHLALMQRQCSLLEQALGSAPAAAPRSEDSNARDAASPRQGAAHAAAGWQAIERRPDELTPGQRRYLDRFMERYCTRTRESKRLAASSRPIYADGRGSLGFRRIWKEIVYPVVARTSSGSRFTDVDGNEYVDLAMGFGVHLFGHSPDFVTSALQRQIAFGMALGPQSDLAGEVASALCAMTGSERALFTNTGTEAVMAALRLVRTIRNKDKVALFSGSYHGWSDLSLARSPGPGSDRPLPGAPGVPQGGMESLIVLPYGEPGSLESIRRHASELAAVMVEPVQSRRPDFQPKEFLLQLRELTRERSVPLIFDEMISGFRIHAGGAQHWFGIQADLATYGKIVGGGMPIGVVAGKHDFLDACDGGMWNYGDDSCPLVDKTMLAGTFCKHPLAMAAALAVLAHLREQGPQLQEQLNEKTAALEHELNSFFESEMVPMRVRRFGSQFTFAYEPKQKWLALFLYHMVEQGVYLWEGGTCFLSTAHSAEDIALVAAAVRNSIAALRSGGFLDGPEAVRGSREIPAAEPVRASLTPAQYALWVAAQMGEDASRAYNESLTLRLKGALDVAAIERAIGTLVERRDALRTAFARDGSFQEIAPSADVAIEFTDLSQLESAARARKAAIQLALEVRTVFDLARPPLFRARLLKVSGDEHILSLTFHHIIADAWSIGLICRDLRELYGAYSRGASPPPARSMSFREYVENRVRDASVDRSAEHYWLGQFADGAPLLELPLNRQRPSIQTFASATLKRPVEDAVAQQLRKAAGAMQCTLFTVLYGAFAWLLRQVSGQNEFLLGIHAAGQPRNGENVAGLCVTVLPFRIVFNCDGRFSEYARLLQARVIEAYDHSDFHFSALLKKLGTRRDPARPPLVSVVFNLDHAQAKEDFAGLRVEALANPSGFSPFEFSVNAVDSGSSLSLECTYNVALFDRETVAGWMDLYRAGLAAIADNPDLDLGALLSAGARPAQSASLT